MKKVLLIALAAALSWAVAGCGEKPSVIVYKQGKYQGKSDSQPWDNEQFQRDRATWERTVKTRNSSQNEYARAGH